MSFITYIKNFVISTALTILYSGLILMSMIVTYLKKPFTDPWAQKLRLEPPSSLTDPKFGVHKYMIFNNTKLHYVESGDPSKPLMIFLHGFPEFWYSWRHQIVEFSKDYWCIAVDMRGYGDSEKPEGRDAYKIGTLVDDVRDIVRKLGPEKCILVSHDWGTIIATKFRDTYPEAVLGLVVLGGTSMEGWFKEVWTNKDQFKQSWYVFLFHAPWVPEKWMQMNDLMFFDIAMRVKGKDAITDQDIECYKYWFGKPTALTPPLNYYRSNFSYVVQEKPRCELPIPFIAINGAKDRFLCPGLLDRLKENYAHVETVLLDNCAHFIQQEEPTLVNRHIREFLKKHKI